MSAYRSRVTEDYIRGGVRIQIIRRVDSGGYYVMKFEPATEHFLTEEDARRHQPLDEALFIPNDAARALWEELSDYFGGQPAAITDRSDLQAERARADKLIDAVIRIAVNGSNA